MGNELANEFELSEPKEGCVERERCPRPLPLALSSVRANTFVDDALVDPLCWREPRCLDVDWRVVNSLSELKGGGGTRDELLRVLLAGRSALFVDGVDIR